MYVVKKRLSTAFEALKLWKKNRSVEQLTGRSIWKQRDYNFNFTFSFFIILFEQELVSLPHCPEEESFVENGDIE